MDGRIHAAQPEGLESVTKDILDFFFTSVGATLTEVKDVELRYLIILPWFDFRIFSLWNLLQDGVLRETRRAFDPGSTFY
jgi:hypothetical protein